MQVAPTGYVTCMNAIRTRRLPNCARVIDHRQRRWLWLAPQSGALAYGKPRWAAGPLGLLVVHLLKQLALAFVPVFLFADVASNHFFVATHSTDPIRGDVSQT